MFIAFANDHVVSLSSPTNRIKGVLLKGECLLYKIMCA